MRRNRIFTACAGLLLCLLLGCGGGSDLPKTGSVVMSFEWPQATRQMSLATQSIVIIAENATGFRDERRINRPTTGTTTDIEYTLIPIGTMTFTAAAYPERDGYGIPQAIGTLEMTINPGSAARIPMTMHSTITYLVLAPSTVSLTLGDGVMLNLTAYNAERQVVLTSPDELEWKVTGNAASFDAVTGLLKAVKLGRATISVVEKTSHCMVSTEVNVIAPRNGKIYYISTRDTNFEIYSINADGTGEKRLTNNTWKEDEVNVSPDGSKVIYSSYETGISHIFRMNPDGSGKEQLTDGSRYDYGPSYTPDGTRILFFRSMENGDEIYIMDADGQNLQRLTTNRYGDVLPKMTADGEWIVFSRLLGTYYHLFKMKSDGTGEVELTTGDTDAWVHSLSSDGTRVLFTYGACIVEMNLDGTGEMRFLTTPRGYRDWIPSYSPDNQHVVFCSNRIDNGGTNYEIYVMDIDGNNQRRLTESASTDYFPVWAP